MRKSPQKPNDHLSRTLTRRLFDIHEASEYVGIPVNTLYKMVSQRRIPYVKVGRLLKFDLAHLDAWIKQQTVLPMPKKSY